MRAGVLGLEFQRYRLYGVATSLVPYRSGRNMDALGWELVSWGSFTDATRLQWAARRLFLRPRSLREFAELSRGMPSDDLSRQRVDIGSLPQAFPDPLRSRVFTRADDWSVVGLRSRATVSSGEATPSREYQASLFLQSFDLFLIAPAGLF
jgi:hypothetical protein